VIVELREVLQGGINGRILLKVQREERDEGRVKDKDEKWPRGNEREMPDMRNRHV